MAVARNARWSVGICGHATVFITYVCISFNNTRVYCMTVALILALVGSIMVYAAPYDSKGALLAGYYLVSSPIFVE